MTDIAIPARLARRPRDHRGFVVPYFVAWLDADSHGVDEPNGTPDFRVVDPARMRECVRHHRCWLCGDKMGARLAFVLGPMCTINNIISEPPSHRECAEYAMRACPFLARPRMRRNAKDMPTKYVEAAGLHADRNPGVMALWMTRSYKMVNAYAGNAGVLFRVGPAEHVEWWREGRHATRDEVLEALTFGYDTLKEIAATERGGIEELDRMFPAALATVPA